ncbi:hypothetical protein PSWA111526_25855 [Pseudomonas wadenswilerensis]|uniref:Uncharacterized protein n=2 Tax=Pseudomonas wadenswilerensis TaxID=1785161 RepID=A0A380SVE9_9PSED|nr:hypothetical protein CCOS864_00988 [Pseudomonas wadenswilerensis]
MAFRADEAARMNLEEVEKYLIPHPRDLDQAERTRSKEMLADIVGELGPVVDSYPSWHPLVLHHNDHQPVTIPGADCGYQGLDHTRYFAHGFVTCPYGDGKEVVDSVNAFPWHPAATITAEILDVTFYNTSATPILVKCEWERPLGEGGTIPLSIAMPLLLEKEVPGWRWADVAETWETMRHYILGSPHGSRSSLFVNQETGQALKKMWEMLINSGMYGPIYPRR